MWWKSIGTRATLWKFHAYFKGCIILKGYIIPKDEPILVAPFGAAAPRFALEFAISTLAKAQHRSRIFKIFVTDGYKIL